MTSIGGSALATVQARRFSARTQANMRKRGGATGVAANGVGAGGRVSFYKQMYGPGAKNGVRTTHARLSDGPLFFSSSRLQEININDQFVHACENGDYNTVNRILEENPKFNIDVTDQLGRTAMRLAIENEHLEVRFELIDQQCLYIARL